MYVRIYSYSDSNECDENQGEQTGCSAGGRYDYKRLLALASWNPTWLIIEISCVPAVRHMGSAYLQPGDLDPVPTRDPADRRLVV
jgi:hypothetical protein